MTKDELIKVTAIIDEIYEATLSLMSYINVIADSRDSIESGSLGSDVAELRSLSIDKESLIAGVLNEVAAFNKMKSDPTIEAAFKEARDMLVPLVELLSPKGTYGLKTCVPFEKLLEIKREIYIANRDSDGLDDILSNK